MPAAGVSSHESLALTTWLVDLCGVLGSRNEHPLASHHEERSSKPLGSLRSRGPPAVPFAVVVCTGGRFRRLVSLFLFVVNVSRKTNAAKHSFLWLGCRHGPPAQARKPACRPRRGRSPHARREGPRGPTYRLQSGWRPPSLEQRQRVAAGAAPPGGPAPGTGTPRPEEPPGCPTSPGTWLGHLSGNSKYRFDLRR